MLKAKAQALLPGGANPRDEHEWKIYSSQELPGDKVLLAEASRVVQWSKAGLTKAVGQSQFGGLDDAARAPLK
jgi:hypothetical protein